MSEDKNNKTLVFNTKTLIVLDIVETLLSNYEILTEKEHEKLIDIYNDLDEIRISLLKRNENEKK